MADVWSRGRYRTVGVAAAVGGLLWMVPYGGLGGLLPTATPLWVAGILGISVPAALTIGGVAGVRARWGDRLGRWGRLGSTALVVGLAFVGVGGAVVIAGLPAFDATGTDGFGPLFWAGLALNSLGLVLQAAGGLLLGGSLWRRGLGPRAGSGLLVAGVATLFAGPLVGLLGFETVGAALDASLTLVVFGLAWVVYGGHFLATADGGG